MVSDIHNIVNHFYFTIDLFCELVPMVGQPFNWQTHKPDLTVCAVGLRIVNIAQLNYSVEIEIP